MKHFNVPAIDGIPGIMPGTVQVPPPPEDMDNEEDEEPETPQSHKRFQLRKGG